jgi:hypothetical protein
MATLNERTPDPFKAIHHEESSESWMKREDDLIDKLQAVSDALTDPITDGYTIEQLTKALVGRILKFPYADGYATYRVTSVKPLKLQPLAYCDAWQVPYITIRGTQLRDVVGMVLRSIELKKIFARK